MPPHSHDPRDFWNTFVGPDDPGTGTAEQMDDWWAGVRKVMAAFGYDEIPPWRDVLAAATPDPDYRGAEMVLGLIDNCLLGFRRA